MSRSSARSLLAPLAVVLSLLLCGRTLADCSVAGRDGNRILVRCGQPAAGLELLSDAVFAVTLFPDGVVRDEPSLVVSSQPAPPVAYELREDRTGIQVRTASLMIEIDREEFRLTVRDTLGSPLLEDFSPAPQGPGGPSEIRFALRDDRIYGLGERALPLDRRGQRFDTYNRPVYGYAYGTPTMNINVPLLISSRGYGLYFDTPWPGVFDLGASRADRASYRLENGLMRAYFLYGPSPAAVLDRYTALTGRQPLPPRWALGYHQSKFGYRDQREAEAVVERFRRKGIPLDALVLDLYWYGQPADMGNMTWDRTAWPDPAGMIERLRRRGVRTVLIEEPYVTVGSTNFDEAAAGGHLALAPDGRPYRMSTWVGVAGLLDVTRPATRAWWWAKHRPLVADGVAGWWLDLGEPETHPDDTRHAGGPARAVHNLYNNLWLEALYHGERDARPDRRPFFLSRSGSAGLQRLGAFTWSGDVQRSFSGLAAQVPMMLGMGMSGLAYHGSDIGGFTGPRTSPELYVRWMQYGAFCPFMRAHSAGQDPEPWAFGEEAERICTEFIELRYRLLPYIYDCAEENSASGMPLARPLALAYPGDSTAASLDTQYLWGDAFLVAPVTNDGARARRVYLPAGGWTDFWTGRRHAGPLWLDVPAPLERLPLFVRDGAIVPVQSPVPHDGFAPLDTLTLEVLPADSSRYVLYEDDGESMAYERGESATTEFALRRIDWGWRFDIGATRGSYAGQPGRRTYRVRFWHVSAPPRRVTVDGVEAPGVTGPGDLPVAGPAWWHDPGSGTLVVQHTQAASAAAAIGVAVGP